MAKCQAKRGAERPLFNSNVLFAYQEADCLTVKIKNDCLPCLCYHTMTKGAFAAKRQKKRGASAPLVFTTLRFFFFSRANAIVLDRETCCLTRHYGGKPYGHCPASQKSPPSRLRRRLLRLRTELLAKHSTQGGAIQGEAMGSENVIA